MEVDERESEQERESARENNQRFAGRGERGAASGARHAPLQGVLAHSHRDVRCEHDGDADEGSPGRIELSQLEGHHQLSHKQGSHYSGWWRAGQMQGTGRYT
eukprot:2133106-Rhodomonas_salina.2